MEEQQKAKRRGRRNKRGILDNFRELPFLGRFFVVLLILLFLVALVGMIIAATKISKIKMVTLNTDELRIEQEAEEEAETSKSRKSGYLNVALFGVDSREDEIEEGTRTDTIMIASLNRKTLEVKIASIYRDSYLRLEDGSFSKANAAYAYGGPKEAIQMLNENLDMNITKFVTVNFAALIDVIDAVGGVEIDVQEEEISYINGYATEIIRVTGKDSVGVFEPGPQVLNGVQATAYARIRYTEGDDYRRAERQQEVLTKVMEKLQSINLTQLNRIIDKVFPEVYTNFKLTEIVDYAKDVFDYKLVDKTGFPFDKTTTTLSGAGSVVIPVTLESNVKKLHTFFYGTEKKYKPTKRLKNISEQIVWKVGERMPDADWHQEQKPDTSGLFDETGRRIKKPYDGDGEEKYY